jgi:hypothetical protein
VDVRGESALRFDGGEVLHVVADEPAQVLHEPIEESREVERVPNRLGVVVGSRVNRGAIGLDPAVRRTGQGDEQRRPERLAVRGGVGLADRPGIDSTPRQGRGILAAAGRAVTAFGPGGQDVAASRPSTRPAARPHA